MKNRKIAITLLLSNILLLSGCNNPNSSSLSSNNQSSITSENSESSLPSVSWGVDYTASDVYNIIKNIADGGNYTLEYEYSDSHGNEYTFNDFYTEDYAYFGATGEGYIALPDYNNENDQIFYLCQVDINEKVTIKRALSYTDSVTKELVAIRSTDNLDYMKLVNSELANISLDDIKEYQKGYYTDNEDLIVILVNLLGYSNSVNLVDKILFHIEEQGLRFTLVPNFNEGYELIDGVNALFKDVGSTLYQPLKSYKEAYKLPEYKASNAVTAAFNNDVVSLSAKVTRIWDKFAADELQDTKFDVSNDKAYFSKYYGRPDYAKLSSPVNKYYEKDDSGNAVSVYLGMDNVVKREDTGIKFDEMFISPSKYYEANSFRSADGVNYRYYGINARNLIKSISNYDLGIIETVDMKVENDKITQIIAKTPKYYDMSGNRFYTQAVINFDETRSFESVVSLTPNKDTESIKTVLDMFDGSTSFKADLVTDGDKTHKTTITVCNNIMLFEENTYDTSLGSSADMIKKYYGYHQTEDGLVPFNVELNEDEQGVTTGVALASDDLLEGKTLRDAIGFVGASEVFAKNNKGQIVINNTVDKVHHGVLNANYAEYIIPSSFTLSLDINNNPLKMSYNYEMDSGYYLGEETITFSEWGNATLPAHISFSQIGLWVEPTSWEEVLTPQDYQTFITVTGEDNVKMLPFLYAKELDGSWVVDYNSEVGGTYLHIFSHEVNCEGTLESDFYKNYATKYAELLTQQGFVETTDNGWGLAAYNKNNLNIRIVYNEEIVDFFIFKSNEY